MEVVEAEVVEEVDVEVREEEVVEEEELDVVGEEVVVGMELEVIEDHEEKEKVVGEVEVEERRRRWR